MSTYLRFHNLRKAFRALVGGDINAGQLALDDLSEFCRADRSCVIFGKDGRVDTHATAVAEGRREVFLRIQQMLNLTDSQLNKLRIEEEITND
jgi:hypothetical protein